MIAFIVTLGSLIASTVCEAQSAPPLAEVRAALCTSQGLSGEACQRAEFVPVGSIDLDPAGSPGWIFVLRSGGAELCHVRHACFSIVERRTSGWSATFSGLGGSVGLLRGSARARRALIVTASESAEEQAVTLYRRHRRRGYEVVRRRLCSYEGGPQEPPLCSAIRDEVVLQ